MTTTSLAVGSHRIHTPRLAGLRAQRVLPPIYPVSHTQPALPWRSPPELVPTGKPIDPELQVLAITMTTAVVEALTGQRASSQLRAKFVPAVDNGDLSGEFRQIHGFIQS